MAMQRNVFRFVMIAVFCWVSVAQAQSFRCGGGLASVGDSKAAVLHTCGEPAMQHSFCQAAAQPSRAAHLSPEVTVNVQPCVTVDEWTFNPGKGKFLTTLRFENGQLSAISQGDRIRD